MRGPALYQGLSAPVKVLLCLMTMSAPPAFAEPNMSPRDLVKGITQDLVTALQVSRDEIRRNPALARKLADDIVLPHVDLSLIARRVLGRHWRTASAAQRRRFTHEFSEFLINIYVTAMVTYADEIVSLADGIRYPAVRLAPEDKRASVRTLISMAAGGQAEVVYRLHRRRGSWKIHDVTILGVSFTLTYRNDFSRQIARSGLDHLIEQLAARNRKTKRASRPAGETLPEG